jgi:RhtB (resistance to homoserine/threonine) family protein
MFAQFFTVGLVVLFGAMLPGPDFAIVTKNSLFHSRRSGLFTSLGVASAIVIHMSYCLLGLALVISESLFFFNLIKYVGAVYLVFLGLQSLFSKQPGTLALPDKKTTHSELSAGRSFWQGFLTNLLNPKATLFFLALFTVLIKPDTSFAWELTYAIEIPLIALLWFCSLTYILSHPRVKGLLEKAEKYIAKLLGVFLVGFGVALAFIEK